MFYIIKTDYILDFVYTGSSSDTDVSEYGKSVADIVANTLSSNRPCTLIYTCGTVTKKQEESAKNWTNFFLKMKKNAMFYKSVHICHWNGMTNEESEYWQQAMLQKCSNM